jgi:hypothetical protein
MMALAGLLIVMAGMIVERRGYLARLGYVYGKDAEETVMAEDSDRRPAAKNR